ncbi:MAG TPA: helix-turn-helix transcriptional regulator [Planctomycetota bacterium]|nr:helix-turn-helix transcriptional regulator [Planctomycetota bacterium]
MNVLKARRIARGVSQRRLAAQAGVSFRTVQLLESGKHDWRLSTLKKVATALGLPHRTIERMVERTLSREADSAVDISDRMVAAGESSWPVYLFNFVDEFRRQPRRALVEDPPDRDLPKRLQCLIASTVESLCEDIGMEPPEWCWSVGSLAEPWFVSGTESLKALALVHSPAHFRKRNIFVLDNFLNRA